MIDALASPAMNISPQRSLGGGAVGTATTTATAFCPHRWLLHRLKRVLPLVAFLLTVLVVSCSGFVFLNSRSLNTRAIEANSATGGAGSGAGSPGQLSSGGPVMVQFYPDNQNKLLFRKQDVPSHRTMVNNGAKNWDNYAGVVREKLEAVRQAEGKKKSRRLSGEEQFVVGSNSTVLSDEVHIFYYAWYGTPEFDGGKYYHWNHKYLEKWDRRDKKRYPTGAHDPTNDDIGANFFPEGGAYSSRDPGVIRRHMEQIKLSGAGVVVVSWYPPGLADPNGPPSDERIPDLLNAAESEGLKVALLIEPYEGQTVVNLRRHLQYVRDTYGEHPAFYKRVVGRRELPLYYLYDSYRLLPDQWRRLLSSKGDVSVRGTELDAIFLALLVDFKHRADIKKAKFDGFFTYFAANGFSHGSSWKNWNSLADFARRNSLLFVPSVGPGYVDTRVRPWNGQSARDRRKGSYYGMAWRTALAASPTIVSVTSFNEWHEGTQIEPAVPNTETRPAGRFTYLSYEPEEPDFYLRETRHWIETMLRERTWRRTKTT